MGTNSVFGKGDVSADTDFLFIFGEKKPKMKKIAIRARSISPMPLLRRSLMPEELVKKLSTVMKDLEETSTSENDEINIKKKEKCEEELSDSLNNLKQRLFPPGETVSDFVLAQISQEIYSTDLLIDFMKNFHMMDFEGRKNFVQIFTKILKRQIGTRYPTVEYICTKGSSINHLDLGGGYFLPPALLADECRFLLNPLFETM